MRTSRTEPLRPTALRRRPVHRRSTAALLAAAPTAHAADTPLRDLATAKGKVIGTAVTGSKLTGTYGDIAGRPVQLAHPGQRHEVGHRRAHPGHLQLGRGRPDRRLRPGPQPAGARPHPGLAQPEPELADQRHLDAAQLSTPPPGPHHHRSHPLQGQAGRLGRGQRALQRGRHLPLDALVQRPRRRLHRPGPDLGARRRPDAPSSTSTTTTSRASTRRARPSTTWSSP